MNNDTAYLDRENGAWVLFTYAEGRKYYLCRRYDEHTIRQWAVNHGYHVVCCELTPNGNIVRN